MSEVVNKYHSKGRKVMSGDYVCETKPSKRAAERTAQRRNELHRAKMSGVYVPASTIGS